MNPWAFLIIGVGILLVIMGVKGSYANVISALTGKAHATASGSVSSPLPTVLSQTGRIPNMPSGQKPVLL